MQPPAPTASGAGGEGCGGAAAVRAQSGETSPAGVGARRIHEARQLLRVDGGTACGTAHGCPQSDMVTAFACATVAAAAVTIPIAVGSYTQWIAIV